MHTKLDFGSRDWEDPLVVEKPSSVRQTGMHMAQEQALSPKQLQQQEKDINETRHHTAHEMIAFEAKKKTEHLLLHRWHKRESRLQDPNFQSAVVNRIIRTVFAKMHKDSLEELVKLARRRSIRRVQETINPLIDNETDVWFAKREFGFDLAIPTMDSAIDVINRLRDTSKADHRDMNAFEDVRNAKYVPLGKADIDEIAESYERRVITDAMWKMLADGNFAEFQEKTEMGAFVMHVDEIPINREGMPDIKLESTLQTLKRELETYKRPGGLEGRGLRSAKTGELLAVVLFREPPTDPTSQEYRNFDEYLQYGITGKLDYKVRTSEQYRAKIHQILMWDLLLQNKQFAANRLFNLFSQEMVAIMERTNAKVRTILEYQLKHLEPDGCVDDESLVGRYGHNDASAIFTTRRGLHPCADDANPDGPYIIRQIDGVSRKITAAWTMKSGDMVKVRDKSKKEWEKVQLAHGDSSKDEYVKKRYP